MHFFCVLFTRSLAAQSYGSSSLDCTFRVLAFEGLCIVMHFFCVPSEIVPFPEALATEVTLVRLGCRSFRIGGGLSGSGSISEQFWVRTKRTSEVQVEFS